MSRHGLEIRTAGGADAPFLLDLLAQAGLRPAADGLADGLERLKREGGAALMASEWGPPSGLIALHWLHPPAGPRLAVVSTLLVAAEARRRGVGRLLLKAGAQAARSAGCDALQLYAAPEADGLDGFCRSTGFDLAGGLWSRALRKRG